MRCHGGDLGRRPRQAGKRFPVCLGTLRACCATKVIRGSDMIVLTKLSGTTFVLNSDLIETIEENPDTMIRLVNKNYFNVKERMSEVVDKVIAFRNATNGTIRCVTYHE